MAHQVQRNSFSALIQTRPANFNESALGLLNMHFNLIMQTWHKVHTNGYALRLRTITNTDGHPITLDTYLGVAEKPRVWMIIEG